MIAPDSLATLFGSNLAGTTALASVDSKGALPTEVAGVSVALNGRPCGLVFVSPTQINFHVPPLTELGEAQVIVRDSNKGIIGFGAVMVNFVAPALFSLSSTGKGSGAIINAVTGELAPFAIETPEISGGDKRTRLSIFGTAFRFAGNPTLSAEKVNVAEWVQVNALDENLKTWALSVEYAGPAPNFFGLDQINVVLPAELAGVSELTLSVRFETISSNRVTASIRVAQQPKIQSFTPTVIAPGGTLTILGNGFVGNGSNRNGLILKRESGPETLINADGATPGSLTAVIMPIAAGTGNEWYEGPVQLCVEVDGRRDCSSEKLTNCQTGAARDPARRTASQHLPAGKRCGAAGSCSAHKCPNCRSGEGRRGPSPEGTRETRGGCGGRSAAVYLRERRGRDNSNRRV